MSRLKVTRIILILMSLAIFIFPLPFSGQQKPDYKYKSLAEVTSSLKKLTAKYANLCQLSSIGKSYGGLEIYLLKMAAAQNKVKPEDRQSVLVVANSEGVHLPGTEAALSLAETILNAYGVDKYWTDFLNERSIYIIPVVNPDAVSAYFSTPALERTHNGHPVDEDNDGLIDEDGPEDLNGDGLITMMRVKSPEGHWIIDPEEPRLMRPADPKKGEKGQYLLYTEGYDNDADGQINEDGPGGVEINRNFLHDFEYYNKKAGLYPASEPETQALLKFMFDHNNIAAIINFSTENNLLNMQQTGRARAGAERVRVPGRYATFLGLEPNTEYSLKEIAEAMKSSGMVGEVEIDENLVATFLGLGPAMTFDRSDQAIYEELQKEYKNGLKEFGLDYLEKNARGVGQGSFPAFCYYQYGVPVFSFDLWQVPEPKKGEIKEGLTPDMIRSMSSEEFLALGEEKIAGFLQEQGAPPNLNAGMVIKMVQSGQMTPARMAEMMEKKPGGAGTRPKNENPEAYLLNYSDTVLKGKGFVDWKVFNHPDLGQVEIGGFVPYLRQVPPLDQLQNSLKFHIQFSQKLMQKLPVLSVKETKAEKLGTGIYRVTVYLQNEGWLPTSLAQGRRSLTAYPIRASLKLNEQQRLFAGRPVEMIPVLQGGESKKLEWTVQAKKGSNLKVVVWSNRINPVEVTIKLD